MCLKMVAELIIKNIEEGKCATLGLAMKNAQYKDGDMVRRRSVWR